MTKLKCFWVLVFLFLFISICFASPDQITRPGTRNDFKRIELGLMGGPGMPQFDFNNSFSESQTEYWYDSSWWYYTEYDINLAYSSDVSGAAESKFGFGGFVNYLFVKNIGLQFMLESSKFDVPVDASHSVDVSWSYYWGDSYSYSDSPSIKKNTGSLSVIPISFNIITKFHLGSNISGHVSGGLTYYQVDFKAESKGGCGVWYYKYKSSSDLWFLYGDSVLLPISIEDSYSGTGGNAGVGLSFQIHENLGILVDFRYYIAPKKEFTWETSAGNYDTVIFGDTLSISRDMIDTAMGKIERDIKLEVDPSYYRFSFGLQFRF